MNPNQPVTGNDLIGLHLKEFTPDRAAALRLRVAQDPALAAESASIAAAFQAVAAQQNPVPLNQAILDRNWQALRPQLRPHAPISTRWQIPLLAAGLLAATAAGIAIFLHTHYPTPPTLNSSAGIHPANPIFTDTPNPQAEPSPREPAFRANLTSGVYRPKPQAPNAEIHLIGPVIQPQRTPNPSIAYSFPPPPLTLLPTPSLMLEPQPMPQSATPTLSPRSHPIAPAKLDKPAHPHQLDVMLGMGGTFIPEHDSLTANTEPRTFTATRAVVALASLHQQFRPALGYRVTLSYTRPEFSYSYSLPGTAPGTTISQSGSLHTRIFEAAGTYVLQGPHRKRLTTSADAGAALMAFLPSDNADPGASYGYRAAGVLGVNLDYAITKHLGARLGYRAQVFVSPDFRYHGTAIPIETPLVVDNEPSLGVTYTFGKK